MRVAGAALAMLASRAGGQVMVELPDDLDPGLVADLLHGANEAVPQDPPFALFVCDRRTDTVLIEPQLDYRELAMYRRGSHLAFTYASDNSGMATYTSVYPLLLSNSFPSTSDLASRDGLASLSQFAGALAEALAERDKTPTDEQATLADTVRLICAFLADAYEHAGNGQISFSADWWRHIGTWTRALSATSRHGLNGAKRLYAAAGLPVPESIDVYKVSPEAYVSTLRARWGSASSVVSELARLRSIESSRVAADELLKIDWKASFTQGSLKTDSLVSLVALAGTEHSEERLKGWAGITDVTFLESFYEAKGKLLIRRDGADLPTPWQGAAPFVLAKSTDVVAAPEPQLELRDIELVVPFKPTADRAQLEAALQDVVAGIHVSGGRGTEVSFRISSFDTGVDGLRIRGTLLLTAQAANSRSIVVQAQSSGAATAYLADVSTTSVTVIWPREAVLWIRPHGRKSRSGQAGPMFWVADQEEPARVEVARSGRHELACVWGETSQVSLASLRFDTNPAESNWSALNGAGTKLLVDLRDSFRVECSGDAIFVLDVTSDSSRPLSPLIASALGVLPDSQRAVPEGTLNHLETILTGALLRLSTNGALGAVVAGDTNRLGVLRETGPGVFCGSSVLQNAASLHPSSPSSVLLNHPEYSALRRAYLNLGIGNLINSLEADSSTAGLSISRLPLAEITKDKIDALVTAHLDLIRITDAWTSTDRFWARNPFSVVVFGTGGGVQTARAVLLSPLHPIRLAWSWALQVGLHGASDDGVHPSASLSLLDGTTFPAYSIVEDAFGSPSALMPVPVDAHPEDLYLGWHLSVALEGYKPAVPAFIEGRRFPVDGLSGLSQASIGAAIDDFIRVSPQVQTLSIKLEASAPARRSTAIDEGLADKIRDLAQRSVGMESVGGVQVYDSKNRLGPLPRLANLDDALLLARPGFNVQWSMSPSNARSSSAGLRNHVTILEGSATQFAIDVVDSSRTGWIPLIPLRRLPRRIRAAHHVTIDYSLATGPEVSPFTALLGAYESSVDGRPYALKVIPNPAGIADRPNWLVAADAGVDPHTLSEAASAQAGSHYVLWDWRPAAAVRGNSPSATRLQPYFVLAAIPDALNTALRERLSLLNPSCAPDEINRRGGVLIRSLASRAIGLNTLLAIGHHQATGALGFHFALTSLAAWIKNTPDSEAHLVIPVDAVDPFLRLAPTARVEQERRRADLLAVRCRRGLGGRAEITLIPIEIKHYGLGETATRHFPPAGDKDLEDHLQQLSSYQRQMAELCETYRNAVGAQASIFGQRLAALIDAAGQLSAVSQSQLAAVCKALAEGTASVEVGKGLLCWFQARATTLDGASASVEEISGDAYTRRVDVRVDPAAFEACYWNDTDGRPHQCFAEALAIASDIEHPRVQTGETPPTAPDEPTRLSEEAGGSVRSVPVSIISSGAGEAAPASAAASGARAQRLPESEVESRYRTLLAALAEFGVRVDRPRDDQQWREGPGFVEYVVHPAYGVSVSKVESQLDNIKLRLRLPSSSVLGCSTHLGNIVVTVPKADGERYFVDAEDMWLRWEKPDSGFSIPLGEDVAGETVALDLASSNSPHVLIAGVTGSGKSEALLTLLHGAAKFYSPNEMRMLLIDPKQTELTSLSSSPNLMGVIGSTGQDAVELLERAVTEMERRYSEFRQAGPTIRSIGEYQLRGGEMPRWLMVLDEYSDLTSDDADRKAIEKSIKRIAQKARAAGIHLVLSTQKPIVSVVNTVVKGNLPGRIALRVNTAIESRVILDEGGAEQLVGKGDALLKLGSSRRRVQFARYAMT